MSTTPAEDVALLMQTEREVEDRERKLRNSQAATTIEQLASQMGGRARSVVPELGYIGSLLWVLHTGLLVQALSACILFCVDAVTVEAVRVWIIWGCLVTGGLLVAFCFLVLYARLERYWDKGTTLMTQVERQRPSAHAAILATMHWTVLSFLYSFIYGILVCDLRSTLRDADLSLFQSDKHHAAIGQYIQAVGPIMLTLHCGVLTHTRIQWKNYQRAVAGAKEP